MLAKNYMLTKKQPNLSSPATQYSYTKQNGSYLNLTLSRDDQEKGA